jgi:uncharacterized damage-inducible protein DinB
MTQTKILLLNFEEVRRRSLKLWQKLPKEHYNWKPDDEAMTCLEMIRHILESEHYFHIIVNRRGNLGNYPSPWQGRAYTDVQSEIDFANTYRINFIETVAAFSNEDLDTVEIIRSEKNQRRKLGDYLLRIAYHEAVHTGQLLDYYRSIGIDRPLIWD